MPDKEDIEHQRELLAIHRRTLAVYLKQCATLGAAYAPPGIMNGIREARQNIQNIKQNLRNCGEAVEDYPDDEISPESKNSPPEKSMSPTEPQPTIGIVTALPHENVAMKTMLDNANEPNDSQWRSAWRYIQGDIPSFNGEIHRVVLACVDQGNNQAASRATLLLERFPTVQSIIMVGIAGGVPEPSKAETHVRLGDIVVSDKYGVVQYDFIKQEEGRIIPRHAPRPPSSSLLDGIGKLVEAKLEGQRPWMDHIARATKKLGRKWQRPAKETDILIDRSKQPTGSMYIVPRPSRDYEDEPEVFLGAIASSNTLLKDRGVRNMLQQEYGVKAIEMEGSGVADAAWNHNIGYLVVRGICDYCDDKKGDEWQNHAAIVAAAYTRALLEAVPAVKAVSVGDFQGVNEEYRRSSQSRETSTMIIDRTEDDNKLTEADRSMLVKFIVDSERAQPDARRALCVAISLPPNRLNFISGTTDDDFARLLVERLHKTQNKVSLEKLCTEISQDLFGEAADQLQTIRAKVVSS